VGRRSQQAVPQSRCRNVLEKGKGRIGLNGYNTFPEPTNCCIFVNILPKIKYRRRDTM
jgi:hypothetical protein